MQKHMPIGYHVEADISYQFENIGWEMTATFIRIPMSIFSMEGLAAGNIFVSVACIKRAWQAEEKHLADYCEIGASTAGTLSALAFCFRAPQARAAGWILWGIDAIANTVILEEEMSMFMQHANRPLIPLQTSTLTGCRSYLESFGLILIISTARLNTSLGSRSLVIELFDGREALPKDR